jgi:hypothetical protein
MGKGCEAIAEQSQSEYKELGECKDECRTIGKGLQSDCKAYAKRFFELQRAFDVIPNFSQRTCKGS